MLSKLWPMLLVAVLLFTIGQVNCVSILCPKHTNVAPCVCNYNFVLSTSVIKRYLDCEALLLPEELERSVKGFDGHSITELKIRTSTLRYFTEDTFKGNTITVIRIKDSNLQALSNSDLAFEGLEDSLKTLNIENVSFVNDWDWSKLSKLTQLRKLSVTETDLLFLAETFKFVSNTLEVLVFYKNQLSGLTDGIFASFSELNILNLQNNQIEIMKRNMLPKPARKLTYLDLSNNLLSSFPSDFFSEMPILTSLSLSGNSIMTLNQEVFENILPQLTDFAMSNVPLVCDCRMSWLVRSNLNVKLEKIKCENPPQLQGKTLSSLVSSNLWCY